MSEENYEFNELFSFNPPPPEDNLIWSLAKNGCDGYCTSVWQKYDPPISFGGPLIYGQWINIQNHCTNWACYCVPDAGEVYGEVPPANLRVNGQTYTTSCFCLASGTKINLRNKKFKNIEEISYEDEILVWNFDEAKFDYAKPLWIKKKETTNKYILLKFDDGSILKTIDQHRIFNKQKKMFTYPMTNYTPIGTISFNNKGEEIKLISKEYVEEEVEFCNVITKHHINLFSNNVLTSCRFNNLYPIENMKFKKEERKKQERKNFNISDEYFYGLRIEEQQYSPEDVEKYVKNLEKLRSNN